MEYITGLKPARPWILTMRFVTVVAALLASNAIAHAVVAANDQALRAMYCMSVVDLELENDRQNGPSVARGGMEYYKNLAQQRPLTDTEKRELAAVQEFARTGVSELDKELARNRERLRIYWLSNSSAQGGKA